MNGPNQRAAEWCDAAAVALNSPGSGTAECRLEMQKQLDASPSSVVVCRYGAPVIGRAHRHDPDPAM